MVFMNGVCNNICQCIICDNCNTHINQIDDIDDIDNRSVKTLDEDLEIRVCIDLILFLTIDGV